MQEHWRRVIEEAAGRGPAERIVVTHFHPDHLGNAGWLAERYGADLRARLGVAVEAALAAPGGTAALTGTGVERRQKPVRLIHERARPPPAKRARRRS